MKVFHLEIFNVFKYLSLPIFQFLAHDQYLLITSQPHELAKNINYRE